MIRAAPASATGRRPAAAARTVSEVRSQHGGLFGTGTAPPSGVTTPDPRAWSVASQRGSRMERGSAGAGSSSSGSGGEGVGRGWWRAS